MADREILEVDVLIVGAGPGGLACAIKVMDLAAKKEGAEKPNVLVIEKGVSVGAHSLSGAVLDPRALNELIPDWQSQQAPVTQEVTGEEIWFLRRGSKYTLPSFIVPSYLHNTGNYVISVGELTPWLAQQARNRGVEILEGLAGTEIVTEGAKVLGVRCNDTGVGKDGKPGDSHMPGAEIRAKVTVLAEGVRGSLTKQWIKQADLDKNSHPQTYALGIKEIWELPAGAFPPGKIIHTLGFPLQFSGASVIESPFGGSFIYGLDETHLIIGLVVGLDYMNPALDPHDCFNQLKMHPSIRAILEKGKMISYGAKAIPEGGYFTLPKYFGDGFCIVGDSASFLNAARLKGVHLAMKTGMLAGEAIVEALAAGDFSEKQMQKFQTLFEASWAREELFKARHWRAGYSEGLYGGLFHEFIRTITFGWDSTATPPPDHKRLFPYRQEDSHKHPFERIKPDGKLTFDRISDVYYSGTNHEENQPCHLKVPDLNLCTERCTVEYGNPCQYFCPAAVYEWIKPSVPPGDEQAKPGSKQNEDGTVTATQGFPGGFEGRKKDGGHLQINPGNCVHCKTCDIKDPYENITWVTPEGGGGPRYNRM